ncbi:MAG: hypothetical protein UV63_C0014G0002 [Microgenomates group bacterium GW2011_GWC1_43_11]|uniref:Uncharacterized protein n=2 Tax=Candidatus Gottesmaniibacteriota TaxID=1752720 RepID=A0A0G1LBP0_9BACT|nr:MAG: hypothetical protein UV63_C0014G0002 [Microgenomates group bacterium GW2011_GWC1_43_11]KKT35164.1 MAG: hypothetical protein UW22_C0058G0010 [Candidatus Gottesmanbacteria bacterium GW2011_GWB1_44_11c]KKT57379.1 MAG: hypothetical protein UW52_C0068G0010 [Candidatus Gottesmanbacteria bacterium GW2011_GWA1_44_24b]HCM81943.1 hypothetical protein [Patescibacteria group bacterium]
MKFLEARTGGRHTKELDITIIPADPSSGAGRAQARYLDTLGEDDRVAYVTQMAESAQNTIAEGVKARLESEGRAIEERERGNTVRGGILARAAADLPQQMVISENKIQAIAHTFERQMGEFLDAVVYTREQFLEAYTQIIEHPPTTETHIREEGRRGQRKIKETHISEPKVPNLHVEASWTPHMYAVLNRAAAISASPDGAGRVDYNPDGSLQGMSVTGQGACAGEQARISIGEGHIGGASFKWD